MAEKLKQGDSLATEIFDKFNRLVDEVNGMEGGGSLTAEAIKDALGYTPVDNAGVSKLFSQLTTDIDNGLVQAGYAKNSDKLDGKDSSYYLDYNNLSNKPSGGGTGGGSGGGGDAIIDVTSLPENPNPQVLYRVKVGEKITDLYLLFGGEKNVMEGNPVTFEIVDELPEVGKNALSSAGIYAYFVKSNKTVRLYYGQWMTMADLIAYWFEIPLSYAEEMVAGVFSTDEIPEIDPSKAYVIYSNDEIYELYYYKNGWHRVDKKPIIDVTDLPTENISEDVFYRTPAKCKVFSTFALFFRNIFILVSGNSISKALIKWIVVSELPEVGQPVIDVVERCYVAYFRETDKTAYVYDGRWKTFEEYIPQEERIDGDYGGVYSIHEPPADIGESVYNIIYIPPAENEYEIYYYKDGWHSTNEGKTTKITVKTMDELLLALDDRVVSVDFYGHITWTDYEDVYYNTNATNESLKFDCAQGLSGAGDEDRYLNDTELALKCKYIDEAMCCTIGLTAEGNHWSYKWAHGYSFKNSKAFDISGTQMNFSPYFIIVTKRD